MAKKDKSSSDSGLRGRFNGELYVDKKVFFKREDVKTVVRSLKNSKALREHLSESRNKLRQA